jgi:hypothetical protein
MSIEHTPYRKPLNHHERIPWVSSHPKDVKRGTFLGEMSRLATLSSRPETYVDALCHLKTLYVARGYPEPLLNSWLRDNKEKRWQARLQEKVRREGSVFVLKSQFNPVFDSFNVHELFDVIRKEWTRSCEGLAWCNLDGFCAVHNAKRVPKPTNIRRTEKLRADTQYKHRFVMSETPVVPLKRAAPPLESELVQTDLREFVNQGILGTLKRRKLGKERALPTLSEVETVASPTGLPRLATFVEPSADDIVLDDVLLTDPSISCIDNNLLPRLADPDHPLASWCYVWERKTRQTHFVRQKVFDIRKSDFFDRRVMVSRKRTRNLADLFNTWKHSVMQLLDERAIEFDKSDVNDFN